jgi:dTMP kinase
MLITFEGLDFSGKTTQAHLLLDSLQHQPQTHGGKPLPIHFIREPGGTGISERIRDILLDEKHLGMTAVAELLLFSASRTQLVHEVILPALRRGEIVLCDRYVDSTMAYQGYGRGINLEAVNTVNRLATDGIAPDLTFFVDIPVDEIERRKTDAGVSFDRMEASGREFYERVRTGYLALARRDPVRWVCLDGLEPKEEIHRRILDVVENKLGISQLFV